jgi:hypothetical protein
MLGNKFGCIPKKWTFSSKNPPPRWRVAAIAFFTTPPGRLIHVITYRFRGDIAPAALPFCVG